MSYEDVIYGQPSNATFSSKTELVEYSVVLASPASASIRGCSQKKIRARDSISQALDETFTFALQSSLKQNQKIYLEINFSYQTPL